MTPSDLPTNQRLAERVALITGGGSGIGRATAEAFARHGADLIVVDSDADGAAETVRRVEAAGRRGHTVVADVTDVDVPESVVADVLDRYGSLDVVMTAAATSVGKTVVRTTPEEWDRVFAVNVKGTYLWMRAALPIMVSQHRGSIIAIASQLAFSGAVGNAAYVASKGAIVSLVRTTANDHAADGVRVNSLVPGATETPLLERSFARLRDPESARARSISRHPLGRFGRAEEVAAAALFLASDESSFTTGTELRVDGGWIGG
jgi:NAD(P)-dependent dehydrogenase (short-subunit alcohol dehydrogenase family)